MPGWNVNPYGREYQFDEKRVLELWSRLHAGDAEPLPESEAVLAGWVLFHRGEFAKAVEVGLAAGGAGITLANKASAVHATHLENREDVRLELFLQTAERAWAQAQQDPQNPNAWFWHAYCLGRYSQGVSVAKALAQGLGGKVRTSLERVIELQPLHADAHIALGTFHAEVIDKVGELIGGMTYGAKREVGLRMFEEGLRLNPGSAIAMIEVASGLLMLQGEAALPRATRLYEQAANCEPLDALERLNVERARQELRDQ
ncbi:hypothetical protein JI739_18135 [Ramlibacter sp. AW1]|uniref:Tetratricopeptide repeat protein n=1 Tax=Ramlibacter aurantiacus TaxID=2801330 RepID=A0A937D7Q9_9BURK|nr:hypothetical protein [Ramlibacter aurantiacus]MBL0422273.1 hypothetical protein [Ramlibacter aurantiacus]